MSKAQQPGIPRTTVIHSSSGQLIADLYTGEVTGSYIENQEDENFKKIISIDLKEFRKHYGITASCNTPTDIDILDIGYWLINGDYIKPADDWRRDFRGYNYYKKNS